MRRGQGTHDAAHRDHPELQAAQRGAALRAAAAALQRRRGRGGGRRVGRGAEPQSAAGLLPQRSEPDQREAAGKIQICDAQKNKKRQKTYREKCELF